MRCKTHRIEIHIETHEIKIIRFGKRVDAESDDSPTGLATELPPFSETKEYEIEARPKRTRSKRLHETD